VPRILHLTDLHVTKPHTSLDQVWIGADTCLTSEDEAPFDFIVVSGDLSQQAGAKEYEALLKFSEDSLLPRLTDTKDRSRVIFVPGNHDAQWRAPVFEHVRLTDETPDKILTRLGALRERPAQGGTRIKIGDLAHLELYDIKGDAYPSRFANVQSFLESFYQGALGASDCKPFALTDKTPGQDWSCHFFPAQSIVFIGFSSCRHNDEYWHGANIDAAAIAAAQKHVTKLRKAHPGLQVVAVWHHGFSSEIGRPDRLTLQDLGALYGVGARLGFHGHTHLDDLKEHTFLHERFAVIATGSIGAGGSDLPTGVNNQFSIVEVFPSRLRLRRFERHPSNGLFGQKGETQRLSLGRADSADAAPSSIGSHRRTWTVNADGIAGVTVEMENISTNRPLILGVLSPPYCNARGRSEATTEAGSLSIHRFESPDRRIRFSIPHIGARRALRWSYDVSNAVALSREELSLLPERKQWFPNIEEHEDIRSHVVRDDADEFELLIRFVKTAVPTAFRRLVERRTNDASDHHWEPDNVEMARVKLEVLKDGARLHVPAPVVGLRYGIVFAPAPSGRAFPAEASTLTKSVLEECREKHIDALPPLREYLTKALSEAIAGSFPAGGAPGSWVGFLWDAPMRKLLPAFGAFRPASWVARFSAGSAIAGHAFRHARGVAWARDPGGNQAASTIYQERTESGEPHTLEYNWVLSVPLLTNVDGPAIGVISFARQHFESAVGDRHIRELAQLGEAAVDRPDWKRLRTHLHVAFWTTLSEAAELTQAERDYAKQCLAATTSVES
jgi:hypothetical protein